MGLIPPGMCRGIFLAAQGPVGALDNPEKMQRARNLGKEMGYGGKKNGKKEKYGNGFK